MSIEETRTVGPRLASSAGFESDAGMEDTGPSPAPRDASRAVDDYLRSTPSTVGDASTPSAHRQQALRVPQASVRSGADPTVAATLKLLRDKGVDAVVWGDGVRASEKRQIVKALENILSHGNKEARDVAVALVRGGAAIDVRDELGEGVSGIQGPWKPDAMRRDVQKGPIGELDAMKYLFVTIRRSELANAVSPAAALEGNLVHEGKHATIAAKTLSDVSRGLPTNELMTNNEIRASQAAARYLQHRGGAYAEFGVLVNHLVKQRGRYQLAPFEFFKAKASSWQGKGTVRQWLGI